ncbi:short chain dehydrogenase [Xylaria bambusicola]|uniref:short chain dehydrogenase n=1 Tax=Xylaria bambusicola TaxID=326684 RepID=UPI0020081B3A|nr:short chain dehydrogenase [Xylaria bambusicola]KAI0508877.1 short chain dehydrogenase [Xylaria bambusicola]
MSRYADVHRNAAGPGDARPTALQIIKDEGREGTMKDKVFFMTGASSGIGIETARALARTGAKVFLAVRSLERGQKACESFLEPGRVELLQMDTSDMSSVRTAAANFLQKSPTLNLLVCNAAVMRIPTREETPEGFEMQLATNYLGHFLLFDLLKDALLKGSTPEFNSRLVHVSSSGHHSSEIEFDDFQLKKPGVYTGWKAYGQSKLAQIYMSNYVDRNFGPRGLHALSLMPGGIMTNLQKHVTEEEKQGWFIPEIQKFLKGVEQGAATTVYAAVSHEWEGKGGKYLEDCQVAKFEPIIETMVGVKPYAYDEAKQDRLWELTRQTLGLQ